MRGILLVRAITALLSLSPYLASAQSLGNSGTITGTVVDPSGAAIPGAQITIHNPVTNYKQTGMSDPGGAFRLVNVPQNTYHLEITAGGFAPYSQDVDIKNSLPVQVTAMLALAGSATSVTVEGGAAEALEVDPTSHVDADRSQLMKLPLTDPGGGLSQAITYTTGGVTADANGFFHPLGDHAQTSFLIDGQPINDQQSKIFSTQLPVSAIQSMTLVTGSPEAEFGEKTSLVAQISTRSGLGAGRIFGNVESSYGSFGTPGGNFGLGWGTAKIGNFFSAEGVRSGRFLDTPQFDPYHDIGNGETLFDRFDWQPTGRDAFHMNLFAARNWIQIPNSLDQLTQDQRQRVLTWNIAPGYQHTFSSSSLITINPYVRKDQFNYYPSRDALENDTPATQSQQRQLLNWGVRADVATTKGRNTLKYGIDLRQTRLLENFQFGITDPAYNSPCIDSSGTGVPDTALTSPAQCVAAGYQPNVAANPNAVVPFQPSLLPYDLTRGGSLFVFHAARNIEEYAAYVQDSLTLGNLVVNMGFRWDYYDGLVSKNGLQPRLGLAYNIKPSGTVLRVAYARTLETPYNENLLLSSATGVGGLGGSVFGANPAPLQPGMRNQFNAGFQQTLSKLFLLDFDYFWKYTHNAFDFNSLLNTTITFPIAWHNSKLDGLTGRLSSTNIHGFQAYWSFGHTRARFFPPETGGLISQGAPLAPGVFRIDHDQAFQSTIDLRYQRPKNAEWIAFNIRYDSGEVVSGVPDAGASLALTPNQQVTIGLACNAIFATVAIPLRDCVGPNGQQGMVTSKLLTLPQGGYNNFPSQENDDHNPDRVKARTVLNLGIGTDNLLHTEGQRRITASLTIDNLTNQVALFNFLSTFGGTHFLTPRTYMGRLGMTF